MNARLTGSLALNGLLLGFVLWLARSSSPSAAVSRGGPGLTDRVARVQRQPALSLSGTTEPETVEVNEPFHWAQLESSDYRVYLANLRGIGCPETTVRDILIADVDDLFSVRVQALVDEVTGRFWNLLTRKADFENVVEEKAQQLRTLDEERGEIFAALFGNSNPRAEAEALAAASANREHWERLADFLPAEKLGQLAAAKAELERAWTDFLRTPGQTGVQQQAQRKALEAAHDQALREWLTADEYDELRLRQSPAAGLRDRLVGLDWPEETVRAVANLQFATAETQAGLPSKAADLQSRRAQLQQQSEARIRERIGPDAYEALQRATDDRYEPIYRVTQRLELPDTVAAQAYAMRRQAEETADQVRANPSFTAETRQAMLQAIGAETRQSLSATLGAKGWAAYEKIDGGWLPQLTSAKR